MGNKVEILDEEVVYKNNNFYSIKRWIKGVHPELGTIVRGYTGWETLIEIDVIRPTMKYQVIPEVPTTPEESTEKRKECSDL